MIVRLMGGLGNQMFQYAFGASVGSSRGEEVTFSRHGGRPYGLGSLLANVRFTGESASVFTEPSLLFTPAVYDAPQGATFVGYWQTEKYFNAPLVRNAMRLRATPSNRSLDVADSIRQGESAFLHVRRGDYTQGATNAFHGMPTTAYHAAAIERIRSLHGDVKFFVFSDDPAWCRAAFPGFAIVDHNEGAPHEDIWLMSLCRHGVIANSSFSWWGAWLGDEQLGRTVIAPERWFAADIDSRDIVPERWSKCPST